MAERSCIKKQLMLIERNLPNDDALLVERAHNASSSVYSCEFIYSYDMYAGV